MSARVEAPLSYDLPAIAKAAGQPDEEMRRYEDGELVVEGVSQEELEEALADYDDLNRLKEANREKLDEGGRERLKQLGARNLEEASIAAIGMSDELNRYEMSEGRRAELEASLDALQSIRQRWNELIAANEAATTHEALESVVWP